MERPPSEVVVRFVCPLRAGAHPLWKWLKKEKPGLLGMEGIKWNFTKFLVDRDGRVVKRYAPTDTPEKIARDLDAALR